MVDRALVSGFDDSYLSRGYLSSLFLRFFVHLSCTFFLYVFFVHLFCTFFRYFFSTFFFLSATAVRSRDAVVNSAVQDREQALLLPEPIVFFQFATDDAGAVRV